MRILSKASVITMMLLLKSKNGEHVDTVLEVMHWMRRFWCHPVSRILFLFYILGYWCPWFLFFFFDCSILNVFAYYCKSLPLLRPLQCSLFIRTHSRFFIHSHLVCLSFPRCFGIPILHVLLFSLVSRTPPTAPLSLGSPAILNIPSLNRGCDILAVAPTP